MTRDEVISSLCAMMGKVYDNIDPSAERPCDCVCPERNRPGHYRNDGHVIEFMQKAIDTAIHEHFSTRTTPSVCEVKEPT